MAMAMAMAIARASLMEKNFFKFFFNTAKLFRLGGILAFWPPFGILAHASKSAGIVALFSLFFCPLAPFFYPCCASRSLLTALFTSVLIHVNRSPITARSM